MAKLGSTQMLQFYIQYASIAVLYYDYALTFGMEVEYIWNSRFRASTMLYIWCRYALAANIIYLLNISKKLGISCEAGYMISGALSVLGRTAVIFVWSARTYAVFGRNRIVLIFFASLGLACFILDVWHIPILRCSGSAPFPIIGRLLAILMVVFEACSAVLNTFRTVQTLKIGGPWHTQKEGLIYLLLEHGILYFCVVTGFTIAALVLNLRAPGGFIQRLVNAFTLPISGMMTARFILHLRRWEGKNSIVNHATNNNKPDNSLEFARNPNQRSTRSMVDDFGEDPVQRAHQNRNVL